MLHTHICAVESVAQLTGVSRGNHDSGRCVRKNEGWKIGGGMGGGACLSSCLHCKTFSILYAAYTFLISDSLLWWPRGKEFYFSLSLSLESSTKTCLLRQRSSGGDATVSLCCVADSVLGGLDQTCLIGVDFTRFDQFISFFNSLFENISLDIELLVLSHWFFFLPVTKLA